MGTSNANNHIGNTLGYLEKCLYFSARSFLLRPQRIHVSPNCPFTLHWFYIKISSFKPVLTIGIVQDCFICLFSILRNS